MTILRLVRDIADFCYPGFCAACKASADPRQTLCPTCISGLSALESAPSCWKCAMPLPEIGAPCPSCQGKGLPHYDYILRLGVFEHPLSDLIHVLKYQRRWAAGEFLAERLLQQTRVRDLVDSADVLVPVALHPLRHWQRGYNQASIIARYLAKRRHKRLGRPIVRTRNTETQTHLRSRQKRVENVRDAFHLRKPGVVKGRRVLIIDDVMTTGATLQAVARALKPAHPASLDALVLAIADPKGRDFEVL